MTSIEPALRTLPRLKKLEKIMLKARTFLAMVDYRGRIAASDPFISLTQNKVSCLNISKNCSSFFSISLGDSLKNSEIGR